MKSLTKKIIVYSLVGLTQFGLGMAVTEASPQHDSRQYGHQQRYENTHRDRDEMRREENNRHEREMMRRERESEREWRERQRIEEARHDQAMKDLGIAVAVYLLLNQ